MLSFPVRSDPGNRALRRLTQNGTLLPFYSSVTFSSGLIGLASDDAVSDAGDTFFCILPQHTRFYVHRVGISSANRATAMSSRYGGARAASTHTTWTAHMFLCSIYEIQR